jgi:hypothetical protein
MQDFMDHYGGLAGTRGCGHQNPGIVRFNRFLLVGIKLRHGAPPQRDYINSATKWIELFFVSAALFRIL